MTAYAGIDYGLGRTNIGANGIRYGVIPANDVGQAWYDSSEPDYGDPACPKCGNKPNKARKSDYHCPRCKYHFDSDEAYGDEPQRIALDDGEYKATQGGDDCDIFILSAPFFTYAQFCSPCAPGACYLLNPLEPEEFTVTDNDVAKGNNIHPDTGKPVPAGKHSARPSANNRAFCFGHDWFENGRAPYPVYSVETGELVPQPAIG